MGTLKNRSFKAKSQDACAYQIDLDVKKIVFASPHVYYVTCMLFRFSFCVFFCSPSFDLSLFLLFLHSCSIKHFWSSVFFGLTKFHSAPQGMSAAGMLDLGGAHGAAAAANAITSNRFSYSMNLKAERKGHGWPPKRKKNEKRKNATTRNSRHSATFLKGPLFLVVCKNGNQNFWQEST